MGLRGRNRLIMNSFFVLAQLLLHSHALCEEPCQYVDESFQEWRFIDKKYWAATNDPGVSPKGSPNCPGGDMIEIVGKMKISSSQDLEQLQKSTCTKWLETKHPERCASFDKQKWEKMRLELPEKDMRFCIDPYEWPNRDGAAPWVMVTWNESQKLCESRGKRLCTEDEWTFACEGEEALPFPNGYVRDTEKCNIDKSWHSYNSTAMFPRGTYKSGNELNRLWQGYLSGSRTECASPFGVHDMTGNIEEWTSASRRSKYSSVLKGGYWAGSKDQCRSSIRSHGEWHSFYQQGFRCCSDPKPVR